MMDSLLVSEIMAEQKRRDIDTLIKRDHLADLAAAPARSGLRASAAAAIVRLGILLDDTAGRRAAAPQL